MHKHSKYMAIMAFLVAYIFIIALLGDTGENSGIKIGLTVITFIGITFFGFKTSRQFSVKTVVKGQKHREDLMNLVLPFTAPVILVVLLYSLTGFTELNEYIYVLVLTGIFFIGAMLMYFSYYIVLEENGIKANKLSKSPILSINKVSLKYKDIKKVIFKYNTLYLSDGETAIYLKMTVLDMTLILNTITKNIDRSIIEEAFNDLELHFRKKKLESNLEGLNYFNNK